MAGEKAQKWGESLAKLLDDQERETNELFEALYQKVQKWQEEAHEVREAAHQAVAGTEAVTPEESGCGRDGSTAELAVCGADEKGLRCPLTPPLPSCGVGKEDRCLGLDTPCELRDGSAPGGALEVAWEQVEGSAALDAGRVEDPASVGEPDHLQDLPEGCVGVPVLEQLNGRCAVAKEEARGKVVGGGTATASEQMESAYMGVLACDRGLAGAEAGDSRKARKRPRKKNWHRCRVGKRRRLEVAWEQVEDSTALHSGRVEHPADVGEPNHRQDLPEGGVGAPVLEQLSGRCAVDKEEARGKLVGGGTATALEQMESAYMGVLACNGDLAGADAGSCRPNARKRPKKKKWHRGGVGKPRLNVGAVQPRRDQRRGRRGRAVRGAGEAAAGAGRGRWRGDLKEFLSRPPPWPPPTRLAPPPFAPTRCP